MSDPSKTYRIFISSPRDVEAERDMLERLIIEELQPRLAEVDDITLLPLLWERKVTPGMGDIQARVFEQMGSFDIFVGVFWKRFGTPTADHESGAEAEFRLAYKLWEQDNSRPILMYFCERPFEVPKTFEEVEQIRRVVAFREEMEEKGLYWTYRDVDELKELARNHLYTEILRLLERPDKHRQPFQSPAASARMRYLKGLRQDCIQLPLSVLGNDVVDRKTVTLDQVFVAPDVFPLGLAAGRDGDSPPAERPVLSALEAIRAHTHLVLVGDPGSGKSSVVKHALAVLAGAELGLSASTLPGAAGLLPVMVRLRKLARRLASLDVPEQVEARRRLLANQVVEEAVRAAREFPASDFETGIRHAFVDEQVFLVLDGLDEVAAPMRVLVREAVGAALNQYNLPRVIVTCRTRSYRSESMFQGVAAFQIAPLTDAQIRSFVKSWYNARTGTTPPPPAATRRPAQHLIRALDRSRLQALTRNPMLLTTITVIHEQHRGLPSGRATLYDLAVTLLLKRWERSKGDASPALAPLLASGDNRVRRIMERLAFESHRAELDRESADLSRDDALDLLTSELNLGDRSVASDFLDFVDTRAGLLIGRGGPPGHPLQYSFPHRTFQEYLAGCFIFNADAQPGRLVQLLRSSPHWSEAATFGIEYLITLRKDFRGAASLCDALCDPDVVLESEGRSLLWGARIATCLKTVSDGARGFEAQNLSADRATADRITTERANQDARLSQSLTSLLSGSLSPPERAEAGRHLSRLGDPRKELLTLEAIPFCLVPPGPYSQSGAGQAFTLGYAYWLAMHPLTQAQFKRFIDEGGYETEYWWPPSGWAYFKGQPTPHPENIGEAVLQNHPVVQLTWFEAAAYVSWLTHTARERGWIDNSWEIVLPDEWEWEKGARGGLEIPETPIVLALSAHASLEAPASRTFEPVANKQHRRRFPWGDVVTHNDCNYIRAGVGRTSTPGCFPNNVSPYGLYGMSGNVQEWTRSSGDSETEPAAAGAEKNPDATSFSVVRGGSFMNNEKSVECIQRRKYNRYYRGNHVGMRIALIPGHRPTPASDAG